MTIQVLDAYIGARDRLFTDPGSSVALKAKADAGDVLLQHIVDFGPVENDTHKARLKYDGGLIVTPKIVPLSGPERWLFL